MTKHLFFATFLGLAVMLASCNDDPEPTTELNVQPTSVTLASDGAAQTITITSNTTWTLSKPGDASWLTVSSTTGDGKNNVVTLTAADLSGSAQPRTTTLTVTAKEKTKTVAVTQSGVNAPETATVTGDAENDCPEETVTLTATSAGAETFQWYKNGAAIEGATASTYEVTESGSYTASGVNPSGPGPQSTAKVVTINACPPEDAPVISGESSNACPEMTVLLTASAVSGATSYQWYKNATEIADATATSYTVTESGTYTVAAVNAGGPGPQSTAKVVTIDVCDLTIDDLVGEWTVSEKQAFAPSTNTASFTSVTYTITIALKEGTTDSITVSGIGNGAGAFPVENFVTSTVKAGITPSTKNTMLMSIPAQAVTPPWPTHTATVFFALQTAGPLSAANTTFGFSDVAISRDESGTISCMLVGAEAAAPHSYAFARQLTTAMYMYVFVARETSWVKNKE